MPLPNSAIEHTTTFIQNLKHAIKNKEIVVVSRGEFSGSELTELQKALETTLEGAPKAANVGTFMANLEHSVRNKETISIGRGDFSGDELIAVLHTLQYHEEGEQAIFY